MVVGFVISALKIDLIGVPLINIVETLFYTFMYNFICGIWVGLAGMFGIDLYAFIKKNGTNERLSWQDTIICDSNFRG